MYAVYRTNIIKCIYRLLDEPNINASYNIRASAVQYTIYKIQYTIYNIHAIYNNVNDFYIYNANIHVGMIMQMRFTSSITLT
jgi:hypothetical protein